MFVYIATRPSDPCSFDLQPPGLVLYSFVPCSYLSVLPFAAATLVIGAPEESANTGDLIRNDLVGQVHSVRPDVSTKKHVMLVHSFTVCCRYELSAMLCCSGNILSCSCNTTLHCKLLKTNVFPYQSANQYVLFLIIIMIIIITVITIIMVICDNYDYRNESLLCFKLFGITA